MRYSIPVKFVAAVLCALAIVCSCVSMLGIVQVAELGLYTDGFDNWVQNSLQWTANDLADDLTKRYAVRALTNCPDEVLEELGYWYVFEDSIHWTGLEQESYGFAIADPKGVFLEGHSLPEGKPGNVYQIACTVQYPVQVTDQKRIDEEYGTEYVRREVVQLGAYGNKPVNIRYYESPLYQVTVQLDASAVMSRTGTSLTLIKLACTHRYTMIAALVIALAVIGVCVVYLCFAAGKSVPGGPVQPAGLNLLPLDVYLAAGAAGIYGLVLLSIDLINHWIYGVHDLNLGTLTLVGLVFFCIALVGVGFIVAVAAQAKEQEHRWWYRTFTGKAIKWISTVCTQLVKLLPLIWKYVLIAFGMIVPPLVFGYLSLTGVWIWPVLLVIVLLADVAIALYGAYAYGTLLRGAERMAKGDLHTKIDRTYLIGLYAKCADHLNALADTAMLAAQNQMRSERMKTELITNVSHDIKTPLTSIINYVDLLQSAQTVQEQMQYLEVLGRQSQRLKKLIEDLVEMSKASSGNMNVDILEMDPVETVNQVLGEFSDKLDAAELTAVFRQPEERLTMYADGRLTWRVLSNLLSNVIKYALPGTRVYLDVLRVEGNILISLKNISKEPLNVSAEELTERFVRGDTSRNTEGSGLGLNIAKSLMELQKGQLQLLVDGDLFKVTLFFPAAQ